MKMMSMKISITKHTMCQYRDKHIITMQYKVDISKDNTFKIIIFCVLNKLSFCDPHNFVVVTDSNIVYLKSH